MFGAIAKAVFGSSNDRYVKSLDKIVQQINLFETNLSAMSDEELTGLVAQISPVQARIGAAAGAEVAVQLPSISRRAPVVSQIASRPASDSVWRILPIEALAPQRAAPIPTVLTGIDRARE